MEQTFHTIEEDIRKYSDQLIKLCLEKNKYQKPSFMMAFFLSPAERLQKIKVLNEEILTLQAQIIKLKIRKRYFYCEILPDPIPLN